MEEAANNPQIFKIRTFNEKRQLLSKLSFFMYYEFMEILKQNRLGAFIVPTGIGASIGGYAGDASFWARRFAGVSDLIVNPNVVNAGGFSGITENMLYLEGYSLDEFFRGRLNLKPVEKPNKIGVVFDKSIPNDVLNVHINTINAVKTVYDVEVLGYEITEEAVGVTFELDDNGISNGHLQNPETMKVAAEKLLQKGCNAIAVVCFFEDPEADNEDYANGAGTDPVGGVEAIISHYISKELKVPCAHAPAFADYQICSEIVSPKSASEYITPTFLPCILIGLAQAPQLIVQAPQSTEQDGISVNNLDFLVMPYDSLGSLAVLEAVKRNIPVFAVEENTTALNVTPDKLGLNGKINSVSSYSECLSLIAKL